MCSRLINQMYKNYLTTVRVDMFGKKTKAAFEENLIPTVKQGGESTLRKYVCLFKCVEKGSNFHMGYLLFHMAVYGYF